MKIDLSLQKCKACSGNMAQLSKSKITEYLKTLKSWNLNDDEKMIFKKYTFKTFNKSLEFTNLVGQIADEEGHHPDISLGWGYCIIIIHTHAIKGLTINDFILAAKIDKINY